MSSPRGTMPISSINYESARRAAELSVFRGNVKTRRILPIIRRLRNANGIGNPSSSTRFIDQPSIARSPGLISFPYIFFFFARPIIGGCMAEASSILVTKV